MNNQNISPEDLDMELAEVLDVLARALAVVDLVCTVSTDKGRLAAMEAYLAESSVTKALWIAVDSIREGSERINALRGFIRPEQ